MIRQRRARTGVATVAGLACVALALFVAPVLAQQASAPSPTPAPAPIAAPSPPASAGSTPADAAAPGPRPLALAGPTPTAGATPANPDAAKPSEGGSMGETLELNARPAAYIEGKADRDEIYGAITGSIGMIRTEIGKAGLKAAGRPIAVFLEADDVGFKYRAAVPLEVDPRGQDRDFRRRQIGADAGSARRCGSNIAAPTTTSTRPTRRSPPISTRRASTRKTCSLKNTSTTSRRRTTRICRSTFIVLLK